MGSYRLNNIDTGDFFIWVKSLGYKNEYDFWQSLSGLSKGTVYDHMDYYLSTLGYTGSINTKFNQFLFDQVSALGGDTFSLKTLYDKANYMYQNGFDVGSANTILDDDGNIVLDDDGNIVTD